MDDVRLGSTLRAARVRRGWRQADLARTCGVARERISLIERGHIGDVSVDRLRAVFRSLEIGLDLVPRWRGGDLDRMLNLRHSLLHESVARSIVADFPDWALLPEASFSIFGERGVIDLLLWHPGRRALLVIELKTDLVDVNELLGTMDRNAAWRGRSRAIADSIPSRYLPGSSSPLRVRTSAGLVSIGRCFEPVTRRTAARCARGSGRQPLRSLGSRRGR